MNRTITLFLLFLVFGKFVLASQPQRVTVSSYAEFLKGELEGVSVTSDGRLVLSPQFSPVFDPKEAFVYTVVANRAGAVYLGTGNNGKVYRVSPAGQGQEFAKLDEPGVYALAIDSQNRVYAGTSPDGKVYRLDASGKPEPFFDPGEKFIWDMVVDSQDNLYVGTGPKGIIYKVSPTGDGTTFYDSNETHIVELEWDLDKNLLAGSAPGGLLFRIAKSGRAFVLHDSALQEIGSVAVDRYGTIYAAALAGKSATSQAATTKATGKKSERKVKSEESTVQKAQAKKGGRVEVYRIDRDGLVETLYGSAEELAFDILVRSDGSLLLGTGNRGRIVALDSKGFSTLLADSHEEQITVLLEQKGSVLAASSNLGKLYKLVAQPSEKGVYTSEVIDAGMSAKWGTIRWWISQPSTPEGIRLYSRSGNTKNPNGTWSDWSEAYTSPKGSSITSPVSRYLQWKAEFPTQARSSALLSESDAIEEVEITYLQYNLRPRLSDLTVYAPGIAFVKVQAAPPPGGVLPGGPEGAHSRLLPPTIRNLGSPVVTVPPRKVYIPGARSFSWKASDPNNDSLVYSVYLRSQEEKEWRLLKKGLSDSRYTLDGASVPDGIYMIRVVASDLPGNPPGSALSDELISRSFVIANGAPTLQWQVPQADEGKVTLEFSVRTHASALFRVEYSVDGNDWVLARPKDGITDGQEEVFLLELSGIKAGEHAVTVRMVDSVGNLGSARQRITVP